MGRNIDFSQDTIAGGLVTEVAEYLIGDNHLVDIENFEVERGGILTTHKGTSLLVSGTSGKVYGLSEWIKDDESSNIIKETTISTAPLSYAVWRGKVFRTYYGLDKIQYSTDGTTWIDLVTITGVAYITLYKNRLYAVTKTGIVCYCKYNDETSWNVIYEYYLDPNDVNAGSFPIDKSAGDWTTGIANIGDGLLIFRNRGYDIITNEPPSINQYTGSRFIGCIAPKSIAIWDGWAMFLSSEGVYLASRNNLYKKSIPIDYTLQAYSFTTRQGFIGGKSHDQYWLTDPSNTSGLTFIYDTFAGIWWKRKFYGSVRPNIYCTKLNGDLISGDYSTTKLWKHNDGFIDNTSAITSIIRTKNYDMRKFDTKKEVSRFLLWLNDIAGTENKRYDLTIKYYIDNIYMSAYDETIILGGGVANKYLIKKFGVNKDLQGQTIGFGISVTPKGTTVDERFTINAFSFNPVLRPIL